MDIYSGYNLVIYSKRTKSIINAGSVGDKGLLLNEAKIRAQLYLERNHDIEVGIVDADAMKPGAFDPKPFDSLIFIDREAYHYYYYEGEIVCDIADAEYLLRSFGYSPDEAAARHIIEVCSGGGNTGYLPETRYFHANADAMAWFVHQDGIGADPVIHVLWEDDPETGEAFKNAEKLIEA